MLRTRRLLSSAALAALLLTGAYTQCVRAEPALADSTDGTLTVIVENEGPPVAGTAAPAGAHGIIGMRERVTACDGRLVIRPGHPGFTVTATLPIG